MTFLILWIIAGIVFQVLSLPLAPAIGFQRQMFLASVAGAMFAAYFAYWS
jgi:hypothetical protein